jgi:hypothetical protein
MSLPIHVDAYSGYKAKERPRYFTVDEDVYEIATVLDQFENRVDPFRRHFPADLRVE